MTKLNHPLRRELTIGGNPYVLTIEPERFRLVPKGKRKGLEMAWRDLVSGEAALAVALNASLTHHSPGTKRVGPAAAQPDTDARAKRRR